jgi:hypothetical protein
MNFDWGKVEKSKRELRRRLAALPVAEKLRMLEELRERQSSIRRLLKSPSERPA